MAILSYTFEFEDGDVFEFGANDVASLALRVAAIARTDLTLEVGGLQEIVSVMGESASNITLESQAIARGLDEQQLRDLPRNSRDIQDFLTLNPNVVGGFDGIQFLGGRTYGASYIQDGQPSSAGIFGDRYVASTRRAPGRTVCSARSWPPWNDTRPDASSRSPRTRA